MSTLFFKARYKYEVLFTAQLWQPLREHEAEYGSPDSEQERGARLVLKLNASRAAWPQRTAA